MKTKRNLSASIPNETRKAVYARDGYRCALCDDTHGLQIHHIVHRSCGGNDTPCNLITLCWRCHAEAHGTFLPERHRAPRLCGFRRCPNPGGAGGGAASQLAGLNQIRMRAPAVYRRGLALCEQMCYNAGSENRGKTAPEGTGS